MTPQEAFCKFWFGISLFGITAAVRLAVGLACPFAVRRPGTATDGLRAALTRSVDARSVEVGRAAAPWRSF